MAACKVLTTTNVPTCNGTRFGTATWLEFRLQPVRWEQVEA
jgi:hypothetical protein